MTTFSGHKGSVKSVCVKDEPSKSKWLFGYSTFVNVNQIGRAWLYGNCVSPTVL